MTTINDLIIKLQENNPNADTDLVRLAYEFAENAHKGQVRASGEPYIIHPLATAYILAEMRLGIPLVVAALLHDVPEDTKVTVEEIEKNFGKDIAQMVRGITKLGTIKYRGIERYIENLRKMFIAMAQDLRVVFIKFADRLNNLKTLDALPPKKQYRIALETLEIYAPIANRLNMGEVRSQLEDLSFKYIYPEEYKWTLKLFEETAPPKEIYLESVKKILTENLNQQGIQNFTISGRRKHLYSLYKKLLKYDRDISRIHDLIALRIIVPDVSACYSVLGVIHGLWKPLKGRIKDYIAQPKPNGYRSLHTTVFCEDGEIIEFQIRTREMHEEAEFGIAAHWHYDESNKKSDLPQNMQWVQELAKIQKEIAEKQDFLEALEGLKIDIFKNRIFVFTPRGDVIDLPEEATSIDLAYSIHSDIGNSCIGAMVNDEMVPLDQALKSGDVIYILTDKNRKAPSADWLKFAKTRQAKNKIKAALKEKEGSWLKTILKANKK